MKKICTLFFLLLIAYTVNGASYAETKMVTASASFDSIVIFSLEFYQDANVLFTDSITFTNMDPTSTHVMADGRVPGDQKNDTGLLCRTNTGEMWYFKIKGNAVAPFTLDKIKYYLGQPWNRSFNPPWGGAPADGELKNPPGWYNVPSSATTVYTAGTRDMNNLPGGTLCLFSFAINPGGLDPSQTYNCGIVYTLSPNP